MASTSAISASIKPMPGPRNRDAPRFDGRKLRRFLEEFKTLATAAGLDDKKKCEHIVRYCRGEAEAFVETSPEFKKKQWAELKHQLKIHYPPDDEEWYFTEKHLEAHVKKDRNINNLASFDKYLHRFKIISNSLEDKKMLAEWKRDDLFYKGIKPISLRKRLKTIMEQDKKLTDTTKPPAMEAVIESAQNYLKRDRYDSEESGCDDGDMSFDDSDDDGLGDLSSDEEEKRKSTSRSSRKIVQEAREKKQRATKQKKEPEKEKDSISVEVLKQLVRLTTQVEKQAKQIDATKRPLPSWSQNCWMCGNKGTHSYKDSPETTALITSGVIKFDVNGRIVRSDGKFLPKAEPSGGGVAKVLRNELANKKGRASSIEIDKDRFQVLNTSYDCLELNNDNSEYVIMPADHHEKTYRKDDSRAPYERPNTRSQDKAKRREMKEKTTENRVPIPQKKVFVEVPQPPKIIVKRPVEKISDEDTEMKTSQRQRRLKFRLQKRWSNSQRHFLHGLPTKWNQHVEKKFYPKRKFRNPSCPNQR
jgi:hypothetical protein